MKFKLLICVAMAIQLHLRAQQSEPTPHPMSIRVNLFGPLDVLDGNLTGGIEYGIGPRLSLTADLGGVFYSAYISSNKRALGYVFKPGLRYYLSPLRRGYITGDFFYKRVGYMVNDWLERGVVNGVASYQEYRSFIFRKRVAGFQFLYGYKARINKKATVWLEPYGGLSVRLKWQDIKDLPDAVYLRNTLFADGSRLSYAVFPGMHVGLRLVMDLPKPTL